MNPGKWHGRILLLLLSVALLTAAFAPVGQFYLAWIGLAPWLVVLATCKSYRSAFFWSWLAGTFFFIANMWWMANVTIPGMIALMALLGLYWGCAGLIIRAGRLLAAPAEGSVLLRIALIAAVWIAAGEWFRGNWPWGGLPWLYLGYTQTPALPMCQIADITGVAGISFLIAMTGAWAAMLALNRWNLRGLRVSAIAIAAMIAASAGYGLFRLHHELLTIGPDVLVIQPNYPQDNSGQKGGDPEEMMDFHFGKTRQVLATQSGIDLVVWSETMMPPVNPEAIDHYRQMVASGAADERARAWSQFLGWAQHGATEIAEQFHVGILSGGEYWNGFHPELGFVIADDRRNVAYFYDRQGKFSPLRYDKIHLVPFGEFTPFRYTLPWLYRLMVRMGPPDMQYYFLQAGSGDNLTVFPLQKPNGGPPWRLVTPICFEDIDAPLCAKMFRPDDSDPDRKRADVLVNLTNDGWFRANENAQHFQAAVFRSIENRVPTARAVNTGISGFVDPLGRAGGVLPPRTEGTSVQTVALCSRVTFFTRHGEVFAWGCAIATMLTVFQAMLRWMRDVR